MNDQNSIDHLYTFQASGREMLRVSCNPVPRLCLHLPFWKRVVIAFALVFKGCAVIQEDK